MFSLIGLVANAAGCRRCRAERLSREHVVHHRYASGRSPRVRTMPADGIVPAARTGVRARDCRGSPLAPARRAQRRNSSPPRTPRTAAGSSQVSPPSSSHAPNPLKAPVATRKSPPQHTTWATKKAAKAPLLDFLSILISYPARPDNRLTFASRARQRASRTSNLGRNPAPDRPGQQGDEYG